MKPRCTSETVIRNEEICENGIVYRYKLLLTEGSDTASFGIDLYGIFAEAEIEGKISRYKSGGLFSSEEKAFRFFDMIIENRALPINIPYVIEDSFSF